MGSQRGRQAVGGPLKLAWFLIFGGACTLASDAPSGMALLRAEARGATTFGVLDFSVALAPMPLALPAAWLCCARGHGEPH